MFKSDKKPAFGRGASRLFSGPDPPKEAKERAKAAEKAEK